MDVSALVGKMFGNPWVTAVSVMVTVISLPLAIYFYRKSKKEKTPCFAIQGTSLIHASKKKIPSLQLHFHGVADPIDDVSVTRLAFWNAGRETIHKADIVKTDPLVIHIAAGSKILDAEVIQSKYRAQPF